MCPGGPMAYRAMANWAVALAMTAAICLVYRSAANPLGPDTAAAAVFGLATSRATKHGNAMQGEVMPCQLWAMKSRRVVGA
jgi:hypothetical protein